MGGNAYIIAPSSCDVEYTIYIVRSSMGDAMIWDEKRIIDVCLSLSRVGVLRLSCNLD